MDGYDSGQITVNGQVMSRKATPEQMKHMGMGLTPEERKNQGVILIHSIRDNLCKRLPGQDLRPPRHQQEAPEGDGPAAGGRPSDQGPRPDGRRGPCPGGNQQKVVIGNWLNTDPAIMMYDEPSRGIDVNAKQQIFQIMWDQARKGVSSIFVSSELEELLEVCHRILIMHMGHIIGEVYPEDLTIDQLYADCMGGTIE